LLGDALEGTAPSYADVSFDESYRLDLGDLSLEVVHPGPAHTQGDSFVWVADRSTVFAGDIVFVDRLLGLLEDSSISGWPASFEAMAALGPAHVVPGHGRATTLDVARRDTYEYLLNLRARIAALIERGGTIMEAPKIDQSAFSDLEQFESLAGRNAQAAFQQMEWE
jgi:glyoxylase-like metal-dependent hydrolase (beta-lactamase superfamily II)